MKVAISMGVMNWPKDALRSREVALETATRVLSTREDPLSLSRFVFSAAVINHQ